MNHGPPTFTRNRVAAAVGLTLITVATYLPALRAGFIWDDDWWVTQNPSLRTWDGIGRIWSDPTSNQQYYPLTATSFWLEYRFWGLRPLGYHLTNVILHALNAVLLWCVLRRLAVPGAWLAAAIFALHPVQVESVAWITERKNVLSGMFYFLALWNYLRFVEAPRRRSYLAALGLFACALLSKTATCTLPVVIAVVLWWKRGRLSLRDLIRLVPFVALSTVAGLTTAWLETHQTGARGGVWDLSVVQRFLIAGRALWFYAWKLVWPVDLMFVYPRWTVDGQVGWQYLFPLAALGVGIVLWIMRRRIGRGPLAAVGVYAVALAPALGFVNLFFMRYAFVQDHFGYLAGIAIIALTTAMVTQLASSWRIPRRWLAMGLGPCVLSLLAVLTWSRANVFRDSEHLWRDSLSKNPDAWLPHNNLGIILAGKGEYAEAIKHYQRAMQVAPSYPETYFNLGNALIGLKKIDEGLDWLRRGLGIDANHPDVYYTIGYYEARRGRINESIASFRQALSIKPFYRQAHIALGDALLSSSRYDEAMEHFRSAAARGSPFASDYNNLANLLLRAGKSREAESYYRQALQQNPDYADAYYNLGVLLDERGDYAGATKAFKNALRCDPNQARAAFNLGAVLQKSGDIAGAMAAFEAALKTDATSARAHYNLGTLLQKQGAFQSAVDHLRRAVELAPDFGDAHHNLAIALFRSGDYAASWDQVAAARRLHKPLSSRFLQALRERLRQPLRVPHPSPPAKGEGRSAPPPIDAPGPPVGDDEPTKLKKAPTAPSRP